MKVEVRRNISLATHDNSERDESLRIDKDIQQPNDISDTQEPTIIRTTNTIHDASHHAFEILNALFNGVLMLIVWFRLLVLDEIHTKNIFHGKGSIRFGVIRFETLHSAIIMNEIQQSGLIMDGVSGVDGAPQPWILTEICPSRRVGHFKGPC